SEFYRYFMNTSNRAEKWIKAYRQDATFHTNNYMESYHNQLKSYHFGRTRNKRVDRIIYLL
ncbi:uncharacterized protein BX664DRAFT_252087, partial [Halteromyces radiatus]|uniref:uncharacterized protein n=1 Tax=Halteromyces radiatus TaxID=101107 RepID=UPI00221E9F1D